MRATPGKIHRQGAKIAKKEMKIAFFDSTFALFAPFAVKKSPRSGFTFLEVLFAVIIIGVGVIMVAGMFPVAIEQTQANLTESAGIAVGRDALRYIQSVTSGFVPLPAAAPVLSLLPCTVVNGAPVQFDQVGVPSAIVPLPNQVLTVGPVTFAQSSLFPLPPQSSPKIPFYANPAAIALGGNQTLTGDKRYGWIGFYRRDTVPIPNTNSGAYMPAPYAQVWIITAQSTGEGQPPFNSQTAATKANFVAATLAITSTNGSVIELPNTATMAAPNAFVLILYSTDTNLIGQYVRLGSVLGNDSTGKNTFWSLIPGSDLNPIDANLTPAATYTVTVVSGAGTLSGASAIATVFLLGSPPIVGGVGGGAAQDITAVTGFVRVSN